MNAQKLRERLAVIREDMDSFECEESFDDVFLAAEEIDIDEWDRRIREKMDSDLKWLIRDAKKLRNAIVSGKRYGKIVGWAMNTSSAMRDLNENILKIKWKEERWSDVSKKLEKTQLPERLPEDAHE